MRRNLLILLFFILWPLKFWSAHAQSNAATATYKVQTVFIYNFMKYVRWPDEYNTGSFIIGVLGDTKLDEELLKMASTKTANGRKIIIRKYRDLAEVEKKCHILFIAADSNELLPNALQKTKGAATLIITEKDGAAKFGSLINFVSEKGKPRFEMNVGAFERRRLKYDSKLRSVAIVI